jgi:hypothetical protein
MNNYSYRQDWKGFLQFDDEVLVTEADYGIRAIDLISQNLLMIYFHP